MSIKIALNGFGRMGRLAFRQLFDADGYEIVAVNDLTDSEMLAYLLKYDTTQGTYRYADNVKSDENHLVVNERKINVYSEAEASKLPWKKLGVDIVLECSGAYLSKEKAHSHIVAGAKRVIISAPAGKDIPTVVYGVNEQILTSEDTIISAASCSTNALAPMVRALHDYAPIQSGIMTVVHGFTNTQMLLDAPQKKGNFRRSRAASTNIIPTTAEAAKAVGGVIPELDGKLTGSAVRVPVPVGCYLTLAAVVQGKDITEKKINDAMKEASSEWFGYTEEEYVSSDIVGMTYASLFDATQTLVTKINENEYQVRVAAWFDNENSFVSQLVRTTKYLAELNKLTG
ncbi:type I glyceraldehyde-3-phosphate dehydrogenase [Dehalobacter restrictus]|jgi:glyceraldehyde 3-phosphate dehydrogenase|uniref:type I glyceraldehyde-3-phosphate dehydrogenase n=1 Tax=Dehalobacter restrictus TaxID=55583 RepID=UPI00338EA4C4